MNGHRKVGLDAFIFLINSIESKVVYNNLGKKNGNQHDLAQGSTAALCSSPHVHYLDLPMDPVLEFVAKKLPGNITLNHRKRYNSSLRSMGTNFEILHLHLLYMRTFLDQLIFMFRKMAYRSLLVKISRGISLSSIFDN